MPGAGAAVHLVGEESAPRPINFARPGSPGRARAARNGSRSAGGVPLYKLQAAGPCSKEQLPSLQKSSTEIAERRPLRVLRALAEIEDEPEGSRLPPNRDVPILVGVRRGREGLGKGRRRLLRKEAEPVLVGENRPLRELLVPVG